MVLLEFKPCPALSDLVLAYRVVHFSFEKTDAVFCKPYPPRAEQCLNFYPRSPETIQYPSRNKTITGFKSVVIGQQYEVTNRYVSNDFLVLSVVFNPGALFRLTGIPSYELTNQYVDAEAVFGRDIQQLNEELCAENIYQKMIDAIELFLLKQKRKGVVSFNRLDHLSHLVLKNDTNFKIDYLAGESCLSLKQFERRFIQRVGVGPKYFQKIVRFEKAYKLRNQHPSLDWLSIAIQCGYYDYQHMTKDYKDLTHKSPADFHLLDMTAPEKSFGRNCS